MAREIEKLPAEMADAKKMARATPINSESKSRTLDKTILNLEMKSAVDWSMLESIGNGSPMSEENTRSSVEMKKCLMVVGVNTAFSCREGGGSVRATWIHQGKWFKNRQDDGRDSIVSMATKMATVCKAEELPEKLRSPSWNAEIQGGIGGSTGGFKVMCYRKKWCLADDATNTMEAALM
ncbi:probable beta-1,3-galactosyltransferase 2 isoform X1 [Tanacetum coccineum]